MNNKLLTTNINPNTIFSIFFLKKTHVLRQKRRFFNIHIQQSWVRILYEEYYLMKRCGTNKYFFSTKNSTSKCVLSGFILPLLCYSCEEIWVFFYSFHYFFSFFVPNYVHMCARIECCYNRRWDNNVSNDFFFAMKHSFVWYIFLLT